MSKVCENEQLVPSQVPEVRLWFDDKERIMTWQQQLSQLRHQFSCTSVLNHCISTSTAHQR